MATPTELVEEPIGNPESFTPDPESSEALDALFLEANKGEGDDKPTDDGKPSGDDKPADDGKPSGDDKPADDGKPSGDDKPADGGKSEDSSKSDKSNKSVDEFDSIQLPPYTKPKTGEAFETVKKLARERVETVSQENKKLKEENDQLKADVEKSKSEASKLSEKEKSELAELRKFREKVDIEADPAFKEFDQKISANDEGIYSRLKEAGFEEEAIKKIKSLGGPAEVDWDKLGDKVPANLRRYIDRKIIENEDLSDQKKSSLEKAKANASEYLKTRSDQLSKQSEQRSEELKKSVDELLPNLKWFKEETIPATAKPEEKSKIEAHNKFVAEVREDLQNAISDDSPSMKAILSVAFLQFRKLKSDVQVIEAKHATEIKGKETEIEGLKKTLKEKEDFISRIKNSSSRFKDSSAPQSKGDTKKKNVDLTETGEDALDRHLAEIQSKKD